MVDGLWRLHEMKVVVGWCVCIKRRNCSASWHLLLSGVWCVMYQHRHSLQYLKRALFGHMIPQTALKRHCLAPDPASI